MQACTCHLLTRAIVHMPSSDWTVAHPANHGILSFCARFNAYDMRSMLHRRYNVKIITDVAKGGPACMANLESGDQIVVLNDSVANELSHAQAV